MDVNVFEEHTHTASIFRAEMSYDGKVASHTKEGT
jgi:hypothetical protein